MVNLDKAATIAIGLMDDGPSQFKLMGQKLKAKEDAFEKFFKDDLGPIINFFESIPTKDARPDETVVLRVVRVWNTLNPAQKTRQKPLLIQKYREAAMNIGKMNNIIKVAEQQGGAIFEFMRRLVHTGNYIQISNLVYRGSLSKLGAETHRGVGAELENPINKLGGDVFSSLPIGKYYRKRLLDMSKSIEKAAKDFEKLKDIALAAGIT